MEANPRGCLPLITRIAGLGLMLYMGAAIAFGLKVFADRLMRGAPVAEWTAYLPVLALFATFAAFAYAGYVIAGAFPKVRVTDAGVQVRHPLGLSRMFAWAEIESYAEPRGLVLKAHGAPLWWPWRLYRYYFYGLFVKPLRPGILIAGEGEALAALQAAIRPHLPA